MKSLTRKPSKPKRSAKDRKDSERKDAKLSEDAQCCAKISRTTAGCHD